MIAMLVEAVLVCIQVAVLAEHGGVLPLVGVVGTGLLFIMCLAYYMKEGP